MLIMFECPRCGQSLEIDVVASGQQVTCPTCGDNVTIPEMRIGPGTTLGGFLIERKLGHTSTGEVYQAQQLSLRREVALKVFPSYVGMEKDSSDRFLREISLLAALKHPYIVPAYEAGTDVGVHYLAMAPVDGLSLEDHLRQTGSMGERTALLMAQKVAAALKYAWNEFQLLHGGLKPDSILIDGGGEPRLVDLGLAKSLQEWAAKTIDAPIVGTPNYMSPEQIAGETELDCRSDMYSLGMTLYHMVTGQVPFDGASPMETLKRQMAESLPDPRRIVPGLSAGLVTLLEVMLARKREQRHATWALWMEDANRVLAGELPVRGRLPAGASVLTCQKQVKMTAAEGMPVPQTIPQKEERSSMVAVLGVVVAVVAAAAIVWRVVDMKSAGLRVKAAEPVASAPVPDPLATAKQALDEALQYEQAHRDDYDGVLSRLQRVGKMVEGSTLEPQVAGEIKRVIEQRATAVQDAMVALKLSVFQKVSDGKADEALEELANYAGPFAAETAAARLELRDAVNSEKLKAASQPTPEEIRARWAAFNDEVAEALLQRGAAAAGASIAAGRANSALAGFATEIDDLAKLVSQAGRIPETVLASFEADKGKEIAVECRSAVLEHVRVLSVNGGTIVLHEPVEGGSVERKVSVNDLTPMEMIRRLGSGTTPERALMRGLVALGAGRPSAAKTQFEAMGTAFGEALIRALGQREGGGKAPPPGSERGTPDGKPGERRTPEALEPVAIITTTAQVG